MSLNLLAIAAMPAFAQQDRLTEGDWRGSLPFGQDPLQAESMQDRGDSQLTMPPEIPDTEVLSTPDIGQADIRIGSVLIESSTKIDYAVFEEAIEPFLGLDATREDLARLAQEIASAARATGVVLADAHIPPQDVELGIVRVVLTIAAIDAVRIEGSSNRALLEVLEPLVGQTSFQQEMDRRLTLAGDIPGIIVKSAEIASEDGRRVLVVHAEDRPSSRGQFTLDNFGSSRVGPLRGRLQLSATAVFNDSDALSALFQTNPIDAQELIAASLGYSMGLGNDGTRVFLAAGGSKSRIEPGTFYGARDARSEYIAAGATRTLRRSRTTNLWFETQLDYLRVQQEIEEARIQADSIAALSATLRGSLKTRNGWMRAGAQVRQGLDILGANSPGDVLSSRYDADGQFTSLRTWASWDGKLNENTTLNLTLLSQIATEPLLASEEIGIGGPQFGRAFDFYQVSGDQGVLASAELGYVLKDPVDWIDSLQPYIFVDGGHVENLDGGYGGGSLISGGAGLRAQFGTFGLQVETATPLSRSTPNLTSDDPVVNFQLGLGF